MRADLILENARVVTMDSAHPRAEKIAVWNGRVIALDGEVADLDTARRVDCKGAVVVPGFHDSHNHMAGFGRMMAEIDASTMSSLDQLYAAISDKAKRQPPDGWVVASGYDQANLGGHPTRTAIDHVAPGRRVVVNHRTTHMLVASTAVFEALGAMSPGFPVAAGGVIERDEAGEPTGLVAEQAMTPFRNLLRPYSIASLSAAIERAGQAFLTEGITSVCEAGIGDSPIVGSSPVEFTAYQALHDAHALPVRVQAMVAMENLHQVTSNGVDRIDLGLDLGIRTGVGDDWLSIGPLKMFTDGALSSRTASVSDPFLDHGGNGVMQFAPEHVARIAAGAHRAGWQLAIHAIGDRAVDVALDAIEQASKAFPRHDARHRIEHASVVRPDQLGRFAAMGVIPSIQGRFVWELGDGIIGALGAERVHWTYRHKSFLDAGLTTPGGSDRPVAAGAPLLGMQAMVHRVTRSGRPFAPDEAVTAYQALEAYTVHAAFAARQDADKGRIRKRFLADFAILDDDPTAVRPEAIGSIGVLATIVGGDVKYDDAGLFDNE